jgi:hypothetical protein
MADRFVNVTVTQIVKSITASVIEAGNVTSVEIQTAAVPATITVPVWGGRGPRGLQGEQGVPGGQLPTFTQSFNATTDWSGPSAGFYSITFMHGLSSNLIEFDVFNAGNAPVDVERLVIDENTVTLRVPVDPDLRFAGTVWIKTT